MSITSILGVFSTLQYHQTILLEKEEHNAINALWLNRIINISFAILVFFILLVLFPHIEHWLKNPYINKWLWFIPLSIFFAGQNEIYKVWANRKKEYNLLTFNAIFLALLTPALSISLGIGLKDEFGLFIGLFAGQAVPALVLFMRLHKKYDLGLKYINITKVKSIAKNNFYFPAYSMPAELINRLTTQLPVFMLNQYVSPASVGVYNLCIRMLSLPVTFVGNAISTVYQQKATEDYQKKGNCYNVFLKTAKALILISILPTLLILFFGPQIFSYTFGSKWIQAGIYARIFIVMFMLQLIVSPLSYVFFITNKLKLDFFIHILILFLLMASYYIGLQYFNIQWAFIFHSISYSIIYISYFVLSKKFSKGENQVIKSF